MRKLNSAAGTAFWILVALLFLATRLPAMSPYFTIDNVNLALSLERFDPRIHQPQPPGYPLFVLFSRIVNLVFQDATKTFALTGLLTSALCFPLVFSLGRRIFAPWVGRAAVLLLLVTPPFWFASLDSPLRPHLALFSLLTAYCGWRCWNGEKRFAVWGAVALGAGAGFRPELGVFIFPLWLVSAWMGTRSLSAVAKALAVLTVVVLSWLGGMAYAVGGVQELYKLNMQYVVEQSRQQAALGALNKTWVRQLSRLVIWNSMALLASLWAIPFYFKARERVSLRSTQSIFLAAWIVPGLVFQALVHVADPGHTLASIPAFAIVAAYLIYVATQRFDELREFALGAVLVIHTALFLGMLALPVAAEPAGGLRSLKNAFVFATFETSIGELRYQHDIARTTMAELQKFTPPVVPAVVVSSDTTTVNWFTNWRIARYYAPALDFWALGDAVTPHFVHHARRDRVDAITAGNLQIPVPKGGRIIWLLERDGPFYKALQRVVPSLPGGTYVWYTDIAPDMSPFRIMDFEFVPTAF
jgi:4-amino-4-deoxy-L-arabinose transferase-like glycosyltransferase